jgi:protein tyrosine phosphatase (PTP) superfamily phosphohydrolase (DUF442 family)
VIRNGVLGFLAFMVLGNGIILGVSLMLARLSPPETPGITVAGVGHLAVVDAKVWRGAAPSSLASYQALVAAGVTTLVDLRAEPASPAADAPIEAIGLRVVHLPVRDGQTPSEDQIARFLQVVRDSPGTVLLHCGAGVGRTGSMAAAYLVATGQASGLDATVQNLAVGPPSLEQIAFSLGLSRNDADRPPLPIMVVSRILDGPRRFFTQL